MGEKLGDKAPKIFNVNWFRTDKNGKFIWPGFGDNLRVLEWIINRCDNKVSAIETPIGFLPDKKDINMEGLDLSTDTLNLLLSVDKDVWMKEIEQIKEFYKTFGDTLPKVLYEKLEDIEKNFK